MTSTYKNRVILFIAQSGGLPQSETTFAKVLQNNGYTTGLIGKWHLGNDKDIRGDREHHPNRHGFDYFYGLPFTNLKDFNGRFLSLSESVISSQYPNWMAYAAAALLGPVTACLLLKYSKHAFSISNILLVSVLLIPIGFFSAIFIIQTSLPFINSVLMIDGQVVEQPFLSLDSTERFVKEANSFMTKAVQSHQPFLCMINFVKVHSYHMPSSKFKGNSRHGVYGDVVMELDDGVGQVIQSLTRLGVRDNTLVYFTSDNGGHLEDMQEGQVSGGYNGLLRGGKGQGAKEGGIRVPTIISWPNVLPKNTEVRIPVSLMDLFPTILDAASIYSDKYDSQNKLDGKSLIPFLTGNSVTNDDHHRFLMHYCGSSLHGVTFTEDKDHVWKVYFYTPRYKNHYEDKCDYVCQCTSSHVVKHDPPQVFNMVMDIMEQTDLSQASDQQVKLKYQEIIKEVNRAVQDHEKSLSAAGPVESQFSFLNSLWRPNLQPCCSWSALCNCRQNSRNL